MIRATSNRIIVSPEEPVQFQNGLYIGNILPSNQGVVVSVGPGDWHRTKGKIKEQRRVPLEIQVGSRISWRPYQGQELEHDGVKYKVIERDDVLLILY